MNRILTYSLLMTFAASPTCLGATVDIASFGALPSDGKDDTAAINAAISAAKPNDVIVFAGGTYNLIAAFDPDHHLHAYQSDNLTLQGADLDGQPATTLLRHVNMENRETLPHFVSARYSKNITLKNFVFDNSPRHCSAGKVIAKDSEEKWLKVQVLAGLPMDDGMGCYAANAWESAEPPILKQVRSLTYGNRGGTWTIEAPSTRTMRLDAEEKLDFLDLIEVGEFISWQYGSDGQNQLDFQRNDGVTLQNIRVPNIINALTNIAMCKDVTLQRIQVKADLGQLACGPRDAFHLSGNSGVMRIEDVVIEAVRQDPIVLRSKYGKIDSKTDLTHFTVAAETGAIEIPPRSSLSLWSVDGIPHKVTVSSANWDSRGKVYQVVTAEPIPDWAEVGTELKCSAFMPDSVRITNCSFRNNAGCDVILFTDNATLSGNTHIRSMHPAIFMGSNNSTAGVCGTNIKILDSTFTDCGWQLKNYIPGIIAAKNNNQFKSAKVHDMTLRGNTLSGIDLGPAINLQDVDEAQISGNSFSNVLSAIELQQDTTSNIRIHDNKGVEQSDDGAIDPVGFTATASDSYQGREPVLAINSAGLVGLAHSAAAANGAMWSGGSSKLPKWLKIDLDKRYDLEKMQIYNFNWQGFTNRGCKNVEVFYSDEGDDPKKWTSADKPFDLTEAPGQSDYGYKNPVKPNIVRLPVKARWVVIKINSHHSGGYCGLSEIRFTDRRRSDRNYANTATDSHIVADFDFRSQLKQNRLVTVHLR